MSWPLCPGGGIGRRTSFRCWRSQGRGGSSPLLGTSGSALGAKLPRDFDEKTVEPGQLRVQPFLVRVVDDVAIDVAGDPFTVGLESHRERITSYVYGDIVYNADQERLDSELTWLDRLLIEIARELGPKG